MLNQLVEFDRPIHDRRSSHPSDTRVPPLRPVTASLPTPQLLEHGQAEVLARAVTDDTTPLLGAVVAAKLDQWAPVLDHIDGNLGALRALATDVARASTDQQAHATAQLLVALDLDADLVSRRSTTPAPDPRATKYPTGPAHAAEPVDPRARADAVAALVETELGRPLPDEHPAAALWARIAAYLDTPPTAAPVAGQVLQVLPIPDAAHLMSTPSWTLIEEWTNAYSRDGDDDTLVHGLRAQGPLQASDDPEDYARAVLEELTPDSVESPQQPRHGDPDLRARAARIRERATQARTHRNDQAADPRRPDDPPAPVSGPHGPRL
jgi:hypothetical protein